MASRPRAQINGAVLRWARETAGFGVEEAAKRLNLKPERLEALESGADGNGLTIRQLQNAANLYRRTPAAFFLRTVPAEEPTAASDYRGGDGRRGPALSRELQTAAKRRQYFIDTTDQELEDRRVPALPDDATLTDVVDQVREKLGITVADQTMFPSASAALSAWISSFASAFGVLVFQMSCVPLNECRAFSIYHDEYSYAVLNGADPVEARIFSLFHELGHLILRSGGICSVYSDQRIERMCNQFAGELLIPKDLVTGVDSAARIPELARYLKVSQSAIAVRLRDLGVLTQQELDSHLAEATRIAEEIRARNRSKPGGPPYHQIVLRNVGTLYASTIIDAMNRDAITPMDASYYMQSKIPTLERIERDLATRADLSAAEAELV